MKTNLFSQIADLSGVDQWTINISFAGQNEILVSVMLKGQDKQKNLPPMILSGTAEDLDNGFFEALAEPVQQSVALFVNQSEYAKSIEKAKAEITDKPKPANVVKEHKPDEVAESKKAFEKIMKKVSELNSSCKYGEALDILPANSDYPEKKEELEKLRRELEWKKGQLSLL